jgi:hypothetical protein
MELRFDGAQGVVETEVWWRHKFGERGLMETEVLWKQRFGGDRDLMDTEDWWRPMFEDRCLMETDVWRPMFDGGRGLVETEIWWRPRFDGDRCLKTDAWWRPRFDGDRCLKTDVWWRLMFDGDWGWWWTVVKTITCSIVNKPVRGEMFCHIDKLDMKCVSVCALNRTCDESIRRGKWWTENRTKNVFKLVSEIGFIVWLPVFQGVMVPKLCLGQKDQFRCLRVNSCRIFQWQRVQQVVRYVVSTSFINGTTKDSESKHTNAYFWTSNEK